MADSDGRSHPRLAGAPGLAAIALSAGLAATIYRPPRPLLVWNPSKSMPTGLYLVRPAGNLRRGETVIAWPPESVRGLATQRRYLPAGVPLVKRVAARTGDRVCALGGVILAGGRFAARRSRLDRSGRIMPWWSGCRRLRPGELFLLSAPTPAAFDGRYFGITERGDVIGRATLLWAR